MLVPPTSSGSAGSTCPRGGDERRNGCADALLVSNHRIRWSAGQRVAGVREPVSATLHMPMFFQTCNGW